MHTSLQSMVMQATGASHIERDGVIQSLWSGYGEIVRVKLEGAAIEHAVLKHVSPPSEVNHPRGWHSDLSHTRKLNSYAVEMHWYKTWSQRCKQVCRVPECYAADTIDGESVMLLEDLDAAGFSLRKEHPNTSDIHLYLQWLAHFHATFLNEQPTGLWPVGTYWHLATRPDELAAMRDKQLQQAAPAIDKMLNQCQFQTFVHGDAKVANFCFSNDGKAVAAVDFQYVGGGCGIKDVAYFLGSCLSDEQCSRQQDDLLDVYFKALNMALSKMGKNIDTHALEDEWRNLYAVAWTDFYRFLQGWMPNHWKIHTYTRRLAEETLKTAT